MYFYASYLDENNVRVYKNAEGNIEKAPNGFYDPKDGSIHLDINAGDTGKSLIHLTAAEQSAVAYYRELLERRDGINKHIVYL